MHCACCAHQRKDEWNSAAMGSMATICVIVSIGLCIVLWTAGAIYFDVFGESAIGALTAAAWAGFWLLALVYWQPLWKPFLLLLIALVGVASWWLSQRPSQHRDWDPHFACL